MIAIAPCDGSDAQSFNVSGGRVSSAGVPGQCLATADCAPAKLGDVGLAPCGEARCGPGDPGTPPSPPPDGVDPIQMKGGSGHRRSSDLHLIHT